MAPRQDPFFHLFTNDLECFSAIISQHSQRPILGLQQVKPPLDSEATIVKITSLSSNDPYLSPAHLTPNSGKMDNEMTIKETFHVHAEIQTTENRFD